MILGITGFAGSGKDTVADMLVEHHGFVKVSLADPMKRFCREIFDFSDTQLWGPSSERNRPDSRYPHEGSFLSPRKALQLLGTEFGRHCYPKVWLEYCLRVSRRLLNGGYGYSAQGGLEVVNPRGAVGWSTPRGVVINDVRFSNEMEGLRAGGAKLWRIKRAGLDAAAFAHASEQEQMSIPDSVFDRVIDNGGTLEDLHNSVKDHVIAAGL